MTAHAAHDLLIEYLHLIQDRYHCISAPTFRALCDEMKSAAGRGLRGRNFLRPFRRREGRGGPPPPTTIRVCDSITCAMKGCRGFVRSAQARGRRSRQVRVLPRALHGTLRHRTGLRGRALISSITPRRKAVEQVVESGKREAEIPRYKTLAAYLAEGGYAMLKECRPGKRGSKTITEMGDAALRGLGGAGFPAGKKWQIVRTYPGPAPDDDQRRRRRARHVQGPLLS